MRVSNQEKVKQKEEDASTWGRGSIPEFSKLGCWMKIKPISLVIQKLNKSWNLKRRELLEHWSDWPEILQRNKWPRLGPKSNYPENWCVDIIHRWVVWATIRPGHPWMCSLPDSLSCTHPREEPRWRVRICISGAGESKFVAFLPSTVLAKTWDLWVLHKH